MPTCQQIMSVTVSGPLTMGPTESPTATSSHQRGVEPLGPSCSYWDSMASISSSVYGRSSSGVVLLLLPGLGPLGADHQPVLTGEDGSHGRPGTPGRSTRARPARRIGSACRARPPGRCAARTPLSGPEGGPPFAGTGRVEGMHAPERIAAHEVTHLGGHLGHLVHPDEGVAPDQGWRGDHPSPDRGGRIVLVPPQRIVVPVALGHVAEGVDPGAEVVRSHRMRLGDADPLPAAARSPRR